LYTKRISNETSKPNITKIAKRASLNIEFDKVIRGDPFDVAALLIDNMLGKDLLDVMEC